MKIGIGIDVHKLVEGRNLILGGIKIPYEKGLEGHSDADVLIHAIMDAILGALGHYDIGHEFPDTDPKYKDIDSFILLNRVKDIMESKGYFIENIDSVIVAEKPKLEPYIDDMRSKISSALEMNVNNVSVKATTTEKLGYIGRGEGIASHAVVLLNEKVVDAF